MRNDNNLNIQKFEAYQGSKLQKLEIILEDAAKETGLEFIPSKLLGGWVDKMSYPKLYGELDGAPFSLHIEGQHQLYPDLILNLEEGGLKPSRTEKMTLSHISMKMQLPNPEASHFLITGETLFRKVGKLLGQQDIQIGNTILDKQLLLQSDHPALLKSILANEELQRLLVNLPKIAIGRYSFGDRKYLKKVKRQRRKEEEQGILDYHLLFEEDSDKESEYRVTTSQEQSYLQFKMSFIDLTKNIKLFFIKEHIQAIRLIGEGLRKYWSFNTK